VTLQKDVEALRSIPLFAKIEPARLKLLAFTSEHVEFLEGETVCRQGEPGDAAFIVLDGEAGPIAERALRDGVAPDPKPGRADDFTWPPKS